VGLDLRRNRRDWMERNGGIKWVGINDLEMNCRMNKVNYYATRYPFTLVRSYRGRELKGERAHVDSSCLTTR